MPFKSAESLVEECVAQLEVIADRRNALLREMHRMIRRPTAVASLLQVDDQNSDDLVIFLDRFRMTPADPATGSITTLHDSELFAPLLSQTFVAATSPTFPDHSALDASSTPFQQSDSLPASPLSEHSDEDQPGHRPPRVGNLPTPMALPLHLTSHAVDNAIHPAVARKFLTDDDMDVQQSELSTTRNLTIAEEASNTDDVIMMHEPPVNMTQGPTPSCHVSLSHTPAETSLSLNMFNRHAHHSPTSIPVLATVSGRAVVIPTPSMSSSTPNFTFGDFQPLPMAPTNSPASQPRLYSEPDYTIPPARYIVTDSAKKSKSAKRKRDKERDKHEGRKDNEWTSMGLNRWFATVTANPVWKRVSRASKCLLTREWAIAMTELRLIRAVERVELLKREGRWSFRQPKKQRGVGGLTKTHWDHLMDEMKWMRIDFREERRWKIALAYNLSTAILEWHAAGSRNIRLAKGICVRWSGSLLETNDFAEEAVELVHEDVEVDENSEDHDTSLLGVDYDSDDGENESANLAEPVVDALAPGQMIQDALHDHFQSTESQGSDTRNGVLKTEPEDGSFQLSAHLSTTSDQSPLAEDLEDKKPTLAELGLKTTSNDPTLAPNATPSSSGGDDSLSAPWKISKNIVYTPLRQVVLDSDERKLFLDFDDLSAVHRVKAITEADDPPAPVPDFMSLFPECSLFNVLDVPTCVQVGVIDGKKRSDRRSDRDDPHRRVEETTYTKLFVTGDFMLHKPILLGPLQPSKNWKDGQWAAPEDAPSTSDIENPTKLPEERINELFDSRSRDAPSVLMQLQLQAAFLRDRDRRRVTDHHWTMADDALLKAFIDKYPNNWALIAECFNASRLTVSTDVRTPRDCLERWRDKWGSDFRRPQDTPAVPEETAPATPSQMTTRGVKRLASVNVTAPSPTPVSVGAEQPKKRRRHILIQETIRKAGKKRAEALQKQLVAQRKPPAIHETHAQINKLPKRTPAELSRMKAEKEARELQEMQLARKRQEEMNRPNLSQRMNNVAAPQPQQPQQPAANSAQRPLPVIRNQVNISQQQRIATPSVPVANRASPQQIVQAQVRGTIPQPSTTALAQALTSQVQANGMTMNGNVPANGGQFSPPFSGREAVLSPALAPHSSPGAMTTNSPRPPSAQAHTLLQGSNAGTRAGYYMPNVPGYSEQIHTALRLQQQSQQQPTTPQPTTNGFPAGP